MTRGRKTTIRRAPHNNENPYKAVRRATFDGSGLSFEARGVMGYLLMKPDDWEIEIPDLMREGGIGRDKCYRILGELIEHGYLQRIDERDQGKFGGASYLLYESPHTENQDTVEPLPEKPYPEKPYPEKPQQTNKEKNTNQGSETKEAATPRATLEADVGFDDDPNAPLSRQTKTITPQQVMFGAVCEALGWDFNVISDKDRIRVAQAVKILSKANYTVEDIRRFMVEVWFKDWRWEKKAQRPTLEQLRQEIGKLRAGIPVDMPPPTQSKGMSTLQRLAANNGVSL